MQCKLVGTDISWTAWSLLIWTASPLTTGLTGCAQVSTANYQSTLHNIAEDLYIGYSVHHIIVSLFCPT